jgi:protein-S-isoprenylcysteine O-methyltransferase Ste14
VQRWRFLSYVLTTLSVALPAYGWGAAWTSPVFWAFLLSGLVALTLQPTYDPLAAAPKDRGTATPFAVATVLFPVAAVLEARARTGSLEPDGIFALGLGLTIAGQAFRRWAIVTLGRYFTLTVQTQADQPVIRTGPYRFVRHPSYTGGLVYFAGAGLMLHAYVATACGCATFLVLFWQRIRVEEAALVETIGEPYRAFQREVPALVPRLGPSSPAAP